VIPLALALVLNSKYESQSIITSTTDCDSNYWRVASYPTWIGDFEQYQYGAFNMLFHFNAEPNPDGSVSTNNLGSDTKIMNQIQVAHNNDVVIIMVIGGWGYGSEFQGATSSSNRANFVQNIVSRADALGYDGINIDWEDGVNNNNLISLMQELRAKINEVNPNMLLLMDVCCDVEISSMVAIAPYVDSINTMDYLDNPENYNTQIINAGVPASKLVSGIGFWNEAYVYNSVTRALEQAQWVADNGLRGVEVWEIGEVTSATDGRVAAIKDVLGDVPACGSGQCVPSTCIGLGYNCGTYSNGCSGTLNCGSCSTGYSCTGGICIQDSPPTGSCCSPLGDSNSNGVVDRSELGVVITNWVSG